MITANVWTQFKKVLPSEAVLAGVVTSVNASSNTCVVELPNGGTMRVYGTATVNTRVLIRAGEVIGSLPDLPIYNIEV